MIDLYFGKNLKAFNKQEIIVILTPKAYTFLPGSKIKGRKRPYILPIHISSLCLIGVILIPLKKSELARIFYIYVNDYHKR